MIRRLDVIFSATLAIAVPVFGCAPQTRTDDKNLRAEIERLEVEFNALCASVEKHEQLLAELRVIQREIAANSSTIQSLNSQLSSRQAIVEELSKWATASLVLGNQRTPNAAALAQTASGYQVVAVTSHPFQQYAIAAAIQGGVPCRADAASGAIVADLNRDFGSGSDLPMQVAETFNSRIDQLVTLSPSVDSGMQYMVFHDPVSGEQKVAVVQATTGSQSVHTMDRKMETLAQAAFIGGSVWIGNQEEIEPHIEIGTPFVDYCTLGMIYSLGREEFQRKNVSLSIHVKLDSSLIDTNPEKPKGRVNKYLGDTETISSILALGRHLQDNFYERLTRRGLPVVEREYEADVKQEDLRQSLGNSASHITRASHAIFVEVDKQENGADRVSVRLVDVTSGHTIWAANDSRTIVPNRNWRNYILHTGVASVAEFQSDPVRDRVLTQFEAEGSIASKTPKKLILIDEGNADGTYRVRSLYGHKTVEVPMQEMTLTAMPTSDGERIKSDIDYNIGKQILQYAAWRLAKYVAPPAVRIDQTDQINYERSWILPLGSANDMMPGSRFRLLFPSVQSDRLSTFPCVASLTDVLDSRTSRLLLPGNAKMALPVFHDAIAVCDSWEHFRVAVMQPRVPILEKMGHTRILETKQRGYQMGEKLKAAFIETLSKRIDCMPGNWQLQKRMSQQFPDEVIDSQETLKDLKRRGVTHVICGHLKLISPVKLDVHYGLQKIESGPVGELIEGPVIDSIRFQVSSSSL